MGYNMAKTNQTFAEYSEDFIEEDEKPAEKSKVKKEKTKKETKRQSLPRFGKFKKGK